MQIMLYQNDAYDETQQKANIAAVHLHLSCARERKNMLSLGAQGDDRSSVTSTPPRGQPMTPAAWEVFREKEESDPEIRWVVCTNWLLFGGYCYWSFAILFYLLNLNLSDWKPTAFPSHVVASSALEMQCRFD